MSSTSDRVAEVKKYIVFRKDALQVKSLDVFQAKRAVVFTARVHPGETNSSWMMKGLIDFLTSNAPDAKVSGLSV